MFNLRQASWALILLAIFGTTFLFSSCNSDDDEEDMDDECVASFINQVATGTFFGDPFTFVEGTAKEDFADSTQFRIVLYREAVTGDACDNFNFSKPTISIIFSVPKMVGIYELGLLYSLTFNDASTVNQVDAEIAACGAIEITEVSATEVAGQLDATASDASMLNGTFRVQLCD